MPCTPAVAVVPRNGTTGAFKAVFAPIDTRNGTTGAFKAVFAPINTRNGTTGAFKAVFAPVDTRNGTTGTVERWLLRAGVWRFLLDFSPTGFNFVESLQTINSEIYV